MVDLELPDDSRLSAVQRLRVLAALTGDQQVIVLPVAAARELLTDISRQTPIYHVHLPPEPGNLAVRFQAACLAVVLWGELGDLALTLLRWLA